MIKISSVPYSAKKDPFKQKSNKKILEFSENKHFVSWGIFVIVKKEYLMSKKEVRRDEYHASLA